MPEKWDEVKELFAVALDLDPWKRSAFFREACAGDDSPRAEVESLLSSFDSAPTFLEDSPAADLASVRSRALAGKRIGPYRILREMPTALDLKPLRKHPRFAALVSYAQQRAGTQASTTDRCR
jgi:hypothetical protein